MEWYWWVVIVFYVLMLAITALFTFFLINLGCKTPDCEYDRSRPWRYVIYPLFWFITIPIFFLVIAEVINFDRKAKNV